MVTFQIQLICQTCFIQKQKSLNTDLQLPIVAPSGGPQILENEETTTFVPPPFDCGFNFQTVLFCEALKELDIRETHVHYDENVGLMIYKNKAFKPVLPLCVIKECGFNNASVDIDGDRWCNAFHRKPTGLKRDGKYDQCVVKLFNTVLLQRLPRASEVSFETHSDYSCC